MTVLRAVAACPLCFTEEEVWYHKGRIFPTDATECRKCYYVYTASSFIMRILELYENTTMTTKKLHIATK